MKKQRFTLIELLIVIAIIIILATISLPIIADFTENSNRTKDAINLKNINNKISLDPFIPRSLASYAQMENSIKDRSAYICPSTSTGNTLAHSKVPQCTINPTTKELEVQNDIDWQQDYYYFSMHISVSITPAVGDKLLSPIKVNDFSGFNIASSYMGNHTNYGNILSGDGSVYQVEDKHWYKTGDWADIGTNFVNNAPYSAITTIDETTLKRP